MSENQNIDLSALLFDDGVASTNKKRKPDPTGWEPGVNFSDKDKSLTIKLTEDKMSDTIDWDNWLEYFLPPALKSAGITIDESAVIQYRAWEGGNGEGGVTMYHYFKANLIRKVEVVQEQEVDISGLVQRVLDKRAVKKVDNHVPRTFFLHVTDLQAGQADGDGFAGMTARCMQMVELAKTKISELKKAGKPISEIFIPITGDLVEGVNGFYDMQTFAVQLDRRQQVELAKQLLLELISGVAVLGYPVHVAAVPGNHGENRGTGKAFTTIGDNDDIAIVNAIKQVFDFSNTVSSKYAHVRFSIPKRNMLSLMVEVQGWNVTLTHGHLGRFGTGVEGKMSQWAKSQLLAGMPYADFDILFSGHYHHWHMQNLNGGRIWIMSPAMCDMSDYFAQTMGLTSQPGVTMGTITESQKVEELYTFAWKGPKQGDYQNG